MKIFTCALLCLALIGCDDAGSADIPDSGPARADSRLPQTPDANAAEAAEAAMFTAMNEGAYDRADDVIADLETVHENAPANNRATFLLGMAHLWRLAEAGRDPETAPAVGAMHGPLVGQYLGQAHGADPDNAVITGFLGVFQWDFGRIIGNPDMAAQGEASIAQAASAFPEFGLFLQVLAYRQLPADDPKLQAGFDAFWQWLDGCMQAEIDRANPDLTPYLTPDRIAGFTGRRAFCWESDKVPNAAKVAYFYGGDLLLKSGDPAAARVMYENAKLVPGYDAWPHKDALEARLAADLEAQAALYQDGDPQNDPPQGKPPFSCTVCHQGN